MSRRILAACAVPVLALLLRSAPALSQGVEVPVALPDLTGLPEVTPPPDAADPTGRVRADDPRVQRFLAYFAIAESYHVSVASLCRVNALPADYPLRPGMYLRIPS